MTYDDSLRADPPSVAGSAPPPAAAAGVEQVACCAQSDAKSRRECGLCNKPTCKACRELVNSKYVCLDCRDQILQELEAERAGAVRLPPAILAGVAGAVLGGAVWAIIGIATNLAIGYVAVGVGWLAGMAVVIGAGRKKGQVLQIVAVLCAALGLVIGKYFIIVHAIKDLVAKEESQEVADEISYFGAKTVEVFFEILPEVVRPFDALWLILALGIAWRIPKPTAVRVGIPKRGV